MSAGNRFRICERLVALVALAASLAWLPGCEAPLWDAESLAARHPALRAYPGQRLADVRPYYWPRSGELSLFLCRWPDGARIPVAIDAEASDEERSKVERALDAWEGAGLGIRFERVPELSGVGIQVEFVDGMLSWASSTLAECALGDAPGRLGEPLDARIVSASIELGRNDPRLVGSALHELAHALGYQGHPRRGESILRRDAKQLLAASVRVGRGEAFRDDTLSALYALPTGTLLAKLPLPAGRTHPVDALAAAALREGWIGPLLQVGDEQGRIGWLDARGRRIALRLTGLASVFIDPARLAIEPTPSALGWLE